MAEDDTDQTQKDDPLFEKEPASLAKGEFDPKGPKDEAEGRAMEKEPEQPDPAPDTDTVASPQYRDALQHELDAIKQRGEDRKQWIEEQQWAHQQMQKIMSQPLPQMPSFEEAYGGTQQQPPQKQSPLGSMAAYAAIALPLAFAFGRKGPAAWGAMRGIAEGLSSIKHGYDQRARQSAAVWKDQNDLAIRMGDKKMQYYKDIIANRKMDLAQKMQMIGSTADFFHDRDLADQAEVGDWDKVVTKLHQYDTILSNAKKVRLQHEGDIMKYLGSDEEHKEYLSELIRRDPEFRKAALSKDNQKIGDAYSAAVNRYSFAEFDKEYQKRQVEHEEQKAEATERGKERGKKSSKTQSNPLGLNLGEDTSASADENVQLPTDIP